MPRSCDDPDGTLDTRHGVSSGTGFSILLVDLLPHLNNYGAISTFRRLRAALWPVWFPVYASTVLFPHPSAITASGFMLFTRCLPRSSNGLANTTATLGSYYWLGIITSGLTPDKKRLAWLGAQQCCSYHRPPICGWVFSIRTVVIFGGGVNGGFGLPGYCPEGWNVGDGGCSGDP